MVSSYLTVEPFAALFWALGIVGTCQNLTMPTGLASLHRRTVSISLYGHFNCTAVENLFHSHRRHVATPLFLSRYNISKGLSNDLWLCCWLAQVQRQCAEERLDRRRRQQQPAWRPTARKTGSGGRRTGSCRRNCWLAAPDSLHHTQRTQDGMTWQVYSLDNSHCADIRSRYFKHKELIHRNSYHPK